MRLTNYMIILVIFVLLVLGIGWGLPNQKTVSTILHDQKWTTELDEKLRHIRTERKQVWDKHFSASEDEFYRFGKNVRSLRHLYQHELTEEDKIACFWQYISSSQVQDESFTYGAIAQMNPDKLDFNPKQFFNYGNSYLIPVGTLIYALKTLGTVKSDQQYLINNPSAIASMYICGRALNVFSFIGVLFLLFFYVSEYYGEATATAAILAFALSPTNLEQTLISKPHMYAAFWSFFSIMSALNYKKASAVKWILLCGISAGLSIGASLTTILIAPLICFLLFDADDVKKSSKILLCVLILTTGVFLLFNYHVISSFHAFWFRTVTEQCYSAPLGLERVKGFVDWIFALMKSFSPPILILTAIGIVSTYFAECRVLKAIAVWFSFIIITAGFFTELPRIILFINPFAAFFAAMGFISCKKYMQKLKYGVIALSIIAFLPALLFSILFFRNVIWSESYYEPTRDLVQQGVINKGMTSGVYEGPDPRLMPPFPFLETRVINIEKHTVPESSPDVVVVGRKFVEKWENHPLRGNYKMLSNLGLRPSYMWFRNWRPQTETELGAIAYQRLN